MALGIINGALGFKFAIAGNFNLFYVPLVIAVFILLTAAVGAKRFLSSRRKKNGQGSVPFSGPGPAYAAPPYDNSSASRPLYERGYESERSDIALSNMGAPPSYSQQPAKPREMI